MSSVSNPFSHVSSIKKGESVSMISFENQSKDLDDDNGLDGLNLGLGDYDSKKNDPRPLSPTQALNDLFSQMDVPSGNKVETPVNVGT